MAVEIVVLVPLLVMVMVLIVAFGRYVSAEGDAEAAARDAVRAASLQRDQPSALAAAQSAAAVNVPDTLECAPADLRGAFVAGGTVTVEMVCDVSWANLGLIGLAGSARVSAQSSAPLDLYRRTGAP
ncbi:TadE/TadG family type IV pilus assembly protein [uncultured Cellulomonas sp.]|uniref:TadE/TadG family type IV pilus assembly protein n=1 Tax=uncultured Cellulomonas sp. TaxID=189682 RepID=UPI0028F01892|nr:TadE/TadG family type IV pilus assembly protein [uncultured Cellulomonas sp.]